ncbi:MAG: hypothetical protein Q4A09_06415 [Capnocytophaga felis]|nr:hypothetical protein [Capnocytophaga felis]
MMVVLIVSLSVVEALSLQGFDYAQTDKNTSFLRHHTFYITSHKGIKKL